ncbi:MAG: hypothetical protein L3J07_03195 [Candidatus Magasanikbacteria bacterium]|nr:hypothetical protein [Candidatus Magasanikbacteria bacterium]
MTKIEFYSKLIFINSKNMNGVMFCSGCDDEKDGDCCGGNCGGDHK